MSCRWHCVTRSCWLSNAPPSTSSPRAGCCPPSALAARWDLNGLPSTSDLNVVSLALRDPVLLAKQCATIDVLSEGRLLPAFGIGSPLGPEWIALDIRSECRVAGTA